MLALPGSGWNFLASESNDAEVIGTERQPTSKTLQPISTIKIRLFTKAESQIDAGEQAQF